MEEVSLLQKASAVVLLIFNISVISITLYCKWRSKTFQLYVYRFGAFCGCTLYRHVLEVWERRYESDDDDDVFDGRLWKMTVARFKEDSVKYTDSDNTTAMRVWRHALSLEPWFGLVEPSVFVKELEWYAIQVSCEITVALYYSKDDVSICRPYAVNTFRRWIPLLLKDQLFLPLLLPFLLLNPPHLLLKLPPLLLQNSLPPAAPEPTATPLNQ
ncbi:hypothetical protein CPB85DRAFT_1310889 [Mucidula mucida]|nr:hypothetical protein CPB85DRAFT_1310889 [Mucidula mucida]